MRRINPYLYAIAVILLFFAVVGTARALDFWATSGKIDPKTGESIRLTGTDPDEIKGWMTLGEIAEAFGIPLEEILGSFGLPPDLPPETQLKELESTTSESESGLSPKTLRDWLRERTQGES